MGLLMTILPFLKGKQKQLSRREQQNRPMVANTYRGSDVVGKALRNLREQFKFGPPILGLTVIPRVLLNKLRVQNIWAPAPVVNWWCLLGVHRCVCVPGPVFCLDASLTGAGTCRFLDGVSGGPSRAKVDSSSVDSRVQKRRCLEVNMTWQRGLFSWRMLVRRFVRVRRFCSVWFQEVCWLWRGAECGKSKGATRFPCGSSSFYTAYYPSL